SRTAACPRRRSRASRRKRSWSGCGCRSPCSSSRSLKGLVKVYSAITYATRPRGYVSARCSCSSAMRSRCWSRHISRALSSPRRSLRRAEHSRAQPPPRNHPRSRDELVLSQGRAGGRLRLRRVDPGGRSHLLAAADGKRHRGGDTRSAAACRAPAGRRDHGVRIVILYGPGAADWTPEDIRGVMKAVDEIGTIFAARGHEIRKVPVRHDLRWFAVARRADLVFNLCEGVHGKSEWEEHVVGSLEFAGIPVTGASLWTIAACRRKAVANALLAQAGLPIPRWTLAQGKIDDDFPLPAIVKPAA